MILSWFFVVFFFRGVVSHEHLANNPTYPAKSRMGMQYYVAKLHILPKSAIDGSLHTLKEFTILEFTVLSVEIVRS